MLDLLKIFGKFRLISKEFYANVEMSEKIGGSATYQAKESGPV